MEIPLSIKNDPLWKKLKPKDKTNIGKLLQPYRYGQLVEYGATFDPYKRNYVCRKGIFQELVFNFTENRDSYKDRHENRSVVCKMTFSVLCIWDGLKPMLTIDQITAFGTTDPRRFHSIDAFFGPSGLKVLCEPD